MRYRVVVETDYVGSYEQIRNQVRTALQLGDLAKSIPGEIVYLAMDIADTAVLSHDGKTVTRG